MKKRETEVKPIHARELVPDVRFYPDDPGYCDVEPLFDQVTPAELAGAPSDLLIMPTVNSSVEMPEEGRGRAAAGIASPGTWFTHCRDSSKSRLRQRLATHELSSRTVRHLVRAHSRAKRPSIVEVYCDGYLWPFVWYRGIELRSRDAWLEDLDIFSNSGRLWSAKGDPVVSHERYADPELVDESKTEIGRRALAFKRRTAWALWCGDCHHVFTLAKSFEPLTSTPVFDLEHAIEFVDSYNVPGAEGWHRDQDTIEEGHTAPKRVRWLLLHKRNRKIAKHLAEEYKDITPDRQGQYVKPETMLVCPACDSGHEEVARRHSAYWLQRLKRDKNFMIFLQTSSCTVPIMDPE